MMGATALILDFIQILQNPKQRQPRVEALCQALAGDTLSLDVLKVALKTWGIAFDGDRDVKPELSLPQHPYGKYFSGELYPKAYALCQLAYAFEHNGLPQEHAQKLCVIFNDEKKLLDYLAAFAQSAKASQSPVHDACLFTIPDFQEQGFLDEKAGCRFDIFQKMAMQGKGSDMLLMNRDFKRLLPFAFELQKRVVAAKKEHDPEAKPNLKLIKEKIEMIQAKEKKLEALERKKSSLTGPEARDYVQLPNEISRLLVELSQLSAGKLLIHLSPMELRSFYEVMKLEVNQAYKTFLDLGIPAQFYELFKSLNRNEAGINLPDIKIDGKDLGYPGYYFMKVPVQDEEQAARAACFGRLTGCCQSLSGEAGQPCVIHGLTSANGGFYVLCEGDVHQPKVSDRVIAQSWTWRSQSGAIVFDSVEVSDIRMVRPVKAFYERLATRLAVEHQVPKVACGGSSGITQSIGVGSVLNPEEKFVDYQGYHDSRFQRLLYDARMPYLMYSRGGDREQASQSVEKICLEALKKTELPLANNESFIRLLNWVFLEQEFFPLLSALASEEERAGELKKLLKEMQPFVLAPQNSPNLAAILTQLADKPYLAQIKQPNGTTPLVLAAKLGLTEVCSQLIQAGAAVDEGVRTTTRTALMEACVLGHREVCTLLLAQNADINVIDDARMTPLMHAAKAGHSELCLLLLSQGASIDGEDVHKKTPLIHAAASGLTDFCAVLIAKGMNINAVDESGKTALMHAVEAGHSDTCFKLIEMGADQNLVDARQENVLIQAINSGRTDIALKLIDNTLNLELKDSLGRNALLLAALKGQRDVCFALLAKGAKPGVKDQQSCTVLMAASAKGLADVCLKLLESGAPLHEVDSLGRTALRYARDREHRALALQLVEQGANADELDKQGRTFLLEALEQRMSEESCLKILEKSSKLDATNREGKTALMLALVAGFDQVSLKLIEQGVPLEASDPQYGATALMLAVAFGRKHVCQALLDKKANLEAVDRHGSTPLMLAAQYGQVELVRMFIERGADLEAFNPQYRFNALGLAIANANPVICALLVRAGAKLSEDTYHQMKALNDKDLSEALDERMKKALTPNKPRGSAIAFGYDHASAKTEDAKPVEAIMHKPKPK